MEDQITYETIERYLAGELKGRELEEFEARLANEAALREELELHRGIQDAIGDEDAMHFLKAVETAERNHLAETQDLSPDDQSAPVRRPFWRQSYSIAAAILLLFVVGGILLLRTMDGNSPDELYSQYFTVYEGPGEWRGSDSVLNADLKKAFEAYNAKNFDAAMKGFQSIVARDSGNVTARFYQGMSAMVIGNLGLAIPCLQSLSDQPGHSYRSQSTWYLALAHLKQGNSTAAIPLLKSLSEGSGKYPELARELLSKL